MNNMYFDPSVKKYRNTENISILSSKVSTEIQPKYGISISILLWGVLFGFVIGENSFFPRTVLRILFSVFFPYIDTDSQCDDHNIRNRKRTENKHLSDDDHEQLQLSWRRLPTPCDPEGRRAGGSSFVGCPCRQRLSRAHVSPEWAEGGPGSWAPVRRAAALRFGFFGGFIPGTDPHFVKTTKLDKVKAHLASIPDGLEMMHGISSNVGGLVAETSLKSAKFTIYFVPS